MSKLGVVRLLGRGRNRPVVLHVRCRVHGLVAVVQSDRYDAATHSAAIDADEHLKAVSHKDFAGSPLDVIRMK